MRDDIEQAIRDECQNQGYLVSISANHHLWINLARAAITDMRKPTPEMVRRLGKVLYDHYGDHEDFYITAEWETGIRAFIECWIDEALK